MPWRCPACRTEICHNSADARPDADGEYRCHVCRLDLLFDPATAKMEVALFQGDRHMVPPQGPPAITPLAFEGWKTDRNRLKRSRERL